MYKQPVVRSGRNVRENGHRQKARDGALCNIVNEDDDVEKQSQQVSDGLAHQHAGNVSTAFHACLETRRPVQTQSLTICCRCGLQPIYYSLKLVRDEAAFPGGLLPKQQRRPERDVQQRPPRTVAG